MTKRFMNMLLENTEKKFNVKCVLCKLYGSVIRRYV